MRNMTRLGILVETVSKFLRELARCHPALHAQVDQDIIRRFVEREGECFGFGKPSETKRQLPEVGLLRAIPGDRLQLRQPPDGAGRDLLLLQARGG